MQLEPIWGWIRPPKASKSSLESLEFLREKLDFQSEPIPCRFDRQNGFETDFGTAGVPRKNRYRSRPNATKRFEHITMSPLTSAAEYVTSLRRRRRRWRDPICANSYLHHPLGDDLDHLRRDVRLHGEVGRRHGVVPLLGPDQVIQNSRLQQSAVHDRPLLRQCLAAHQIHHGRSERSCGQRAGASPPPKHRAYSTRLNSTRTGN